MTMVKIGAFSVVLVVKNLPANAGEVREADLIPGGRGKIPWAEGMATHSSIFA